MSTGIPSAAVVLVDIVASRRVSDFQRFRDEALERLSRTHRRSGALTFDWTVTTWDEFQGLVPEPARLPAVVFDLRTGFHPLELRIGIGFGSVRSLPAAGEALNIAGSGEAFERARAALESLAGGGGKVRSLTAFDTGDAEVDLVTNLVYRLHDTLLAQLTPRQWETVLVYLEAGRQDLAARQLGVDESTVSRTLRRAALWQLLETREKMSRFLERRLA